MTKKIAEACDIRNGGTRQALAAVSLVICLLLGPQIMRDAYADDYRLSKEEIEGLIELLDKTSFDGAGHFEGYGRLLLWEKSDPIRYWVSMEEVDEETLEWNTNTLRRIHRTIGRNAAIRILRTPDLLDADIAIFSMEKNSLSSYKPFFQYLEKMGSAEDEFPGVRDRIDRVVFQGRRSVWAQVLIAENSSGHKIFKKFVAVLNPEKERFKELFSIVFSSALGYGTKGQVKSRWYSVHMNLGDFKTADHILLHFLYNSEATSGMPREAALNTLRNWLSSEDFRSRVRLVSK